MLFNQKKMVKEPVSSIGSLTRFFNQKKMVKEPVSSIGSLTIHFHKIKKSNKYFLKKSNTHI